MKKTKFFAIAASLLALGFLSCDSGIADDEKEAAKLAGADAKKAFASELPNNANVLGADAFDGTVWDFSTFKANEAGTIGETTIPATDTQLSGEIDPSTVGTAGTKLVATNVKAKANYNANSDVKSGVFQTTKGSATLTSLDKGWRLTLTLATASNIYLAGTGAGSAEAARYIAICDASDNLIVYKNNLGSKAITDFQVQGAPAGDYTIYINGSSIIKIDLSDAHTFELPPSVASIAIKDSGTSNSVDPTKDVKLSLSTDAKYKTDLNPKGYYLPLNIFANYKPYICGTDSEGEESDVSASAKLDIIGDKDVVNIKTGVITGLYAGEVTVRARVGRLLADFVVVVQGSLDDVALTAPSASSLELGLNTASFTAKIAKNTLKTNLDDTNQKGKDLSLATVVTWASSDSTVATVSEGTVTPVKAGEATITGVLTDGKGTEKKVEYDVTVKASEKAVVTLFDTSHDKFPAAGLVFKNSSLGEGGFDQIKLANITTVSRKDATTLGLTADFGDIKDADKDDADVGTVASIKVKSIAYNDIWNGETESVVVTSNKGESDYDGILYTFASKKLNDDGDIKGITISKNTVVYTVELEIQAGSKALKLTDISAGLQENQFTPQWKIGEFDGNKQKKFGTVNLATTDIIEVAANETKTVTITGSTTSDWKEKTADKFGIGNIKLYFEVEAEE